MADVFSSRNAYEQLIMIYPNKLQLGSHIRVISPATTGAIISDDVINHAVQELERYGYKVSFSIKWKESDIFGSSSVESRVKDIHDAFTDESVDAIFTTLGGVNSNQLLDYLDYELIKNNPKILCGYSDITALANAITTKTGLVTYSGPHFSTWGMKLQSDFNQEYAQKCLASEEPFILEPSTIWSDDAWFIDQDA